MSIPEINSNNAIPFVLHNSSAATGISSDITNTLSDYYSESNETSKFKEIVSNYDITNISRNEVNAMYKELYDNGLISLKDLAFATFDPTKIPGWKDGISSICGAKISSNPNEKVNLLNIIKTQADWTEKYGDAQSKLNAQKNLDLAEKIYYFQL